MSSKDPVPVHDRGQMGSRSGGSRPGTGNGSRPGSRGGVSASLEFGDPPFRQNKNKNRTIASNDWRNGGTRGMRKGNASERKLMGLDDPAMKLTTLPTPEKTAELEHGEGGQRHPSRSNSSVPPYLPALAARPATGFRQRTPPKMSAVAAFPREARFTLTPRAYCVETARDAGQRGGYVAASRAFSSALAHAPGDKEVETEFKRSVHDIRKSRPFFQLPNRRRKQFQRGSFAPVEPEPEPEAPSSDEEEDDGPQRRRRAMKEFGELWMRLSRDIKEVMKKEDEEGWGRLKDFLKDQYTVLKEVFQHYCALDASLGAPAGGGGGASSSAPKKSAGGGADDMYTMSALEWLEFAKDIGVVVSRKGVANNKKPPAAAGASSASKQADTSKGVTKGGGREGGEGTIDEEGEAAAAVVEEAESTEVVEEAEEAEAAEAAETSSEQPQTGSKKNRPTVELPEEVVVESVQLEEASLDLIFVRANWERDDSGKMIQDDSNPDHAMLMFEFVHGMLRLSAQAFPVGRDSTHSLVGRFKTFWLKMVVPKANRANIEGFRELIQAKSVQKVLAKNELRLHAVFMNYAAAEDDNDRQACMSLGEFSKLCEDSHMYCEHFKLKNAATIYTHSQQDLDFDEVDPMDVELDFEEFKECLCRAANLINPEEFLRLSVKVEQLMELLSSLALQSAELEHDADYSKNEGEEEEEDGEEECDGEGGEGGAGGGGGLGSGSERSGGAGIGDDELSSSDDDDSVFDAEPADLQSASKRFIVDE